MLARGVPAAHMSSLFTVRYVLVRLAAERRLTVAKQRARGDANFLNSNAL